MDSKHIYGSTILSDRDFFYVTGDTVFDCSSLLGGQRVYFKGNANGIVTLQNATLLNPRGQDTSSSISVAEDEIVLFIYRSPSESYLFVQTIQSISTEYTNEYYVSLSSGKSTYSGKSIESPKDRVSNILSGPVSTPCRFNLMSDSDHEGGWTLSNQNYVTFEGSGKTTWIQGNIEISGTSKDVTFRGLNIASDNTSGTEQAVKFSSSEGNHVIENMFTKGNTSINFIELGVNCFDTTVPDGITTFGKLALTIKNSDLRGTTGIILLPDLSAGQYASIMLENYQGYGISIGTGWYVVYDAASSLGSITYTGSSSSANLVSLSLIRFKEDFLKNTTSCGSLLTRSNSGELVEIVPDLSGARVLTATNAGSTGGLEWKDAPAGFYEYSSEVADYNVGDVIELASTNFYTTQFSGLIQFDLYFQGTGSSAPGHHALLDYYFRTDFDTVAPPIGDFMIKERITGTQVGVIECVMVSGYTGNNYKIQFRFTSSSTYLRYKIRKSIMLQGTP